MPAMVTHLFKGLPCQSSPWEVTRESSVPVAWFCSISNGSSWQEKHSGASPRTAAVESPKADRIAQEGTQAPEHYPACFDDTSGISCPYRAGEESLQGMTRHN